MKRALSALYWWAYFHTAWSVLKKSGQSRVLKTSYMWLVLVPVLARALQAVPDTVQVVWPAEFPLHLKLPFSWRCFYWSAICVALADLLFLLRCPSLIKDHDDEASFRAAGKDDIILGLYKEEYDASFDHTSSEGQPSFWGAFHEAASVAPLSRFVVGALYFIGFALFGIVAIQNFLFIVTL